MQRAPDRVASSVGVKPSELPPTECDSVHLDCIESNYRLVDPVVTFGQGLSRVEPVSQPGRF